MSTAIIKACNTIPSVKNTGKECDSAMVAPAMLIAIDPDEQFDDTDLADPVTWLTGLIHDRKAFPLFGLTAPIREVQNDSEGDQIVTLDDGLKVFMRYGLYNRNLATTNGGLCYAAALQSFLNSGYKILEIDQTGQMLACRDTTRGIYRGLICDFMYSPSPTLADFKTTPYKNRFSYSFSPIELVNNGIIFKNAGALLQMQGLVDAIFEINIASTTTALKVGLVTDCKEDDLVVKLGSKLDHAALYLVEDVAALGTPVTVSGVTRVGSNLLLAGTFITAHTYRVTGKSPAVWLAATPSIDGYDASQQYVDILIP